MPYGTIKVDNITFTNGGSDSTIAVSGLVASITGDLTVTGTVSGVIANFVSGNFSTQLSGATITGNTGQFSSITGISGTFTTRVSGLTVLGTTGTFSSLTGTTITGATGIFASLTGTTITGATGIFNELNVKTLVLEGTTEDDYEVTIACDPTADQTITLPNATTTLAGLNVIQTFTAVQTLTDPAIIGCILEDVYTITDGAAFEVDPSNGSIQLITLGASRTPKATNFAAGESITLMVNDGTAYTITWTDATWGSGGVVWVGGSAPTLATSGYTVIQFWKIGTQVYGARVGDVA